MQARRNGRHYAVAFSDADARIFTEGTGVPRGVVAGAGEFVYDAKNGDLVDRRGAARDRYEPEWLAFSQDAQEYGAMQMQQQGNPVAVYEFAGDMPELAHNPGARKHAHVGRRVELIHTNDPSTTLRPGDQGIVTMVDDANVLYVEWESGETLGLMPGIDTFQFITNRNPARISRTRGVKTMKGPYGQSKGYKPWIKHRGTLGEGFLTTMSKSQREKALDHCVSEWGYRSCLGKIMALERARTGPRGRGKGVGVKYAGKLSSSRDYLRRTYGGEGSFGPRKKKAAAGRKAADRGRNPDAKTHAKNAVKFLEAGGQALAAAKEKTEAAIKRGSGPAHEQACERGKAALNHAYLAMHELEYGMMTQGERARVHQGAATLQRAANTLLDRLGCPWSERFGNPYMGDAVDLARYRKDRNAWERGGRRGPPPVPPQRRAA